MSKTASSKIPVSHARIWDALLDEFGTNPFRLSDLAKRLFKLVRPRVMSTATKAADLIFKDAAKRGEIIRHEHLHWVRANKMNSVVLRSGRSVSYSELACPMTINTHAPEKWALVDMQTGEVYVGDARGGWKRAGDQICADVESLAKAKNI